MRCNIENRKIEEHSLRKNACAPFARYLEAGLPFAAEECAAPERENALRYAVLQARFTLHAFICKACAQKKRRAALAGHILREGFLPPAPGRADAIMAALLAEKEETAKGLSFYVSTRGWIAAGILIVISLLSVYFNGDFPEFARVQGMPYLLPLGITVGAVITAYGALFIGTHIDMLREKFGIE